MLRSPGHKRPSSYHRESPTISAARSSRPHALAPRCRPLNLQSGINKNPGNGRHTGDALQAAAGQCTRRERTNKACNLSRALTRTVRYGKPEIRAVIIGTPATGKSQKTEQSLRASNAGGSWCRMPATLCGYRPESRLPLPKQSLTKGNRHPVPRKAS